MARKPKRNVKRAPTGREEIVRAFTGREWYELPDWAVDWLSRNAGWVTLGVVALLVPIAILGVVLAASSLPLYYVGIPTTSAGLGLAAALFMVKFVLLALAVRPMMRAQKRGWQLVIAAALVHFIDGVWGGQFFSAILFLAIPVYLYSQVRHRFS